MKVPESTLASGIHQIRRGELSEVHSLGSQEVTGWDMFASKMEWEL